MLNKNPGNVVIGFIFIFAFFIQLNAEVELKSLRVYSNNDERIPPILVYSEDSDAILNIDFDVKSENEP